MLKIYKTVDGSLNVIETYELGSWINLVNPTEQEIEAVCENTGADISFVKAALDEEETSRVDVEDNNQTLVIVDVPVAEKDGTAVMYSTLPFGIVVLSDYLITVCLRDVSSLEEIASGQAKGIKTAHKTRFVLQFMLRVAGRYLQYLRQIDKISNYIERQLYKSQKNKELIQLLDLEKSLVYFATSLKSTEVTMEKILRGRILKLYEDDQDLLEDVIIEFKQAIQMADIYSTILSGTMDAFASVISNNLNVIMKVLTSLTIIITIPNIVFGFYGMNVEHLPLPVSWFPLVVSVALMGAIGVILKKKGLF